MSDQSTPETPDPRIARRSAYEAYVESERIRHATKDHPFEPDREFDEDDVEGHARVGCRGCFI